MKPMVLVSLPVCASVAMAGKAKIATNAFHIQIVSMATVTPHGSVYAKKDGVVCFVTTVSDP